MIARNMRASTAVVATPRIPAVPKVSTLGATHWPATRLAKTAKGSARAAPKTHNSSILNMSFAQRDR